MEEIFCLQEIPEITERVFMFLDTPSILKCRLVNKAFNHIIENPHFCLRKLTCDGQQKSVQKLFNESRSIEQELLKYERGSLKERNQIDTRLYQNVRPTQKEVQFYGYWNQKMYFIHCDENEDDENQMLYLAGLFSKFLSNWKQVFANLDTINYKFDKNPILYLLKMNGIISRIKSIQVDLEMVKENMAFIMKKRGKWNDTTICKSKLEVPITICRLWGSFFAITLQYLPTLNCSHCSKELGHQEPKFDFKEICSECHKVYNLTDPPVGQEDSWKFEELNHILDLCFGHRKKLVDECSTNMIDKLLGEKGEGATEFLDVEDYGFGPDPDSLTLGENMELWYAEMSQK